MFGIGTPEVIGIVIITLLVYGPDRLPDMIKKIVGFLRDIKNMTDDVTSTVSKEIHRIERSTEIQEARHLIEQNRNLMAQGKLQIQNSLNQPVAPEQDVAEITTPIVEINKDDKPE